MTVEEAEALCNAGRSKEAAAALERMHMKTALTGRARVLLAQAYYDMFRLTDAERVLADCDETAHALRLRAEVAFERKQPQEAGALAKRALELDPGDSRAKELLIVLNDMPEGGDQAPKNKNGSLKRLAFQAGATAVVLAVIVVAYAARVKTGEQVSALIKTARADRNKMDRAALQRAIDTAKTALDLQDNAQALSLWAEADALMYYEYGGPRPGYSIERILAANIQSGERYFAEAVSLIAAGSLTKAESLATQVIADGGVDARVLLSLALAEKALGRLDKAKDALRRAYDLSPYHPLIAVELGDAYLLEGDLRNADYYWRKAADSSPAFERALQRLRWSADMTAAATDAAKTPNDAASQWVLAHASPSADKLEALAVRFPGVEAIVFDWAKAAARNGKLGEAEAVLQKTPDIGNSPRGQAFLAELSLPTDPKKAEALCKAALATDPTQPNALYVQGRLQQQKGDAKAALDSYSRALNQKAAFPEVYQQVGNIFLDGSEPEKAKEQLLVAERMYRQSGASLTRIHEDLARACEKMGNAKEAAEWRKKK